MSIPNYEDSIQMLEECDKKQEILQERIKRNKDLNKELLEVREKLRENTGLFSRKERERLQRREEEIMMKLDPFSV